MSSDSETAVRRVLAPYREVLASIPPQAWTRYLAIPDRAPLMQATARANVVNRYMIDEADRQLVPLGGVAAIESYGTTYYAVGDQVLLRFKYLGDDGLSRNIATDRAVKFNEQDDLEGIPSHLIRVDVGYRLDMLETSIAAVLATHRAGQRRNAWVIDLTERADTFLLPAQIPLEWEADVPEVRPREGTGEETRRQGTDDTVR